LNNILFNNSLHNKKEPIQEKNRFFFLLSGERLQFPHMTIIKRRKKGLIFWKIPLQS